MEKEQPKIPLKGTICIIDDEPDMVDTCGDILRAQGYEVELHVKPETGLQAITSREFDVVLVDLMMPGTSGLQILKECRRVNPATQVAILTGYPTIETAVGAMKEGAFDYVVKPFMASHLVALVDRAVTVRRLAVENSSLRKRVAGVPQMCTFIGLSPAMRSVQNIIMKVARLHSGVLITGESGTGKELVAKTLHQSSDRADKPFVPINCSALPESLLESELFGFEKGAFSGAAARSIGLFEFANHGTLFLDEIGELTLSLQAKLLRVLQEREIRRVGGRDQISVDIRIVAATNRDLEKMIADGRFREDLFFRLNVIRVQVPPLRDRPEDIVLLAQHFLDAFNARHGKNVRISAEVPDVLCGYSWPGNVRELENAMQQSASMSDHGLIMVNDLPEIIRRRQVRTEAGFALDRAFNAAKAETVRRFEREYALSLLEAACGNVSRAAERAGMHRSSFQRLLRKYRILPEAIKEALIVDESKRGAWDETVVPSCPPEGAA